MVLQFILHLVFGGGPGSPFCGGWGVGEQRALSKDLQAEPLGALQAAVCRCDGQHLGQPVLLYFSRVFSLAHPSAECLGTAIGFSWGPL